MYNAVIHFVEPKCAQLTHTRGFPNVSLAGQCHSVFLSLSSNTGR